MIKEIKMKFVKLAAAAALAVSATTATAGGLAPTVTEQPPIVVEPEMAPKSSLSGWVVPAIALALIAAAAASSSDSDSE